MKKILNEGKKISIHNFISSSGSGTVINYVSGSGSDFLTSYGSYGSGSGSATLPKTAISCCLPSFLHIGITFLKE
jgi:hypothetical protein